MTSLRSALRQLGKLSVLREGIPELIDRTVFYVGLMRLRSAVPIDVVIPAAEKDVGVLPYAIAGIRRNVRHPIARFFVVSPESPRIRQLCKEHRCEHVPEQDLVSIDPKAIHLVVQGEDRSRWIYQQFLKLSADSIVTQPSYLVVDADTVMIRPQVYERDGRVVFNYSDEYYQPYFEMYHRLLGEQVLCPVSFTSHQMLFSVDILRELKASIERRHGRPWTDAILSNLDRGEKSACSDYDTYGQFAFLHHADRVAIEYWSNLVLHDATSMRCHCWS